VTLSAGVAGSLERGRPRHAHGRGFRRSSKPWPPAKIGGRVPDLLRNRYIHLWIFRHQPFAPERGGAEVADPAAQADAGSAATAAPVARRVTWMGAQSVA
jgi:hypothetical protein